MLVDSHAHLNFAAFKNDFDEVIKKCLDNNIWVINVGTKYETSKRAVEIAQKYEKGVYAAVGLHPIHLETGLVKIKNDTEEIEMKTREEWFDYEKYKELAQNKKVVAIGEAGLDYWYKPKTKIKLQRFKEKQRTVLCRQLDLAGELNLPLIFHCRMAHAEFLEVLKSKILQGESLTPCGAGENQNLRIKGVIHCFTGDWTQAKKYLEMGFYLGFNGIIFKLNLDEVIKNTPLNRILIETDCPYLMPPLVKGRNEPIYLKYIAEKVAEIKGIAPEKIIKTSAENAIKLFRLEI